MDDVALPVRQNLKLDVPGFQHQLFQIHFVVSEAGVGLRFGGGISVGQVFSAVAAADAPAAATGAGLQQNGIAHRLRHGQSVLHGGYRPVGAGSHGNPGGAHQVSGGGFGAGLPDGVPGGTDEGDAVFRAGVGKFRVFRQEPVAGVQTVAAGGQGGGEQRLGIQVAVRRFGGADAHGPGGQLDVEGLRIRLRIHRDRLDARLPAGPPHPEGDLPPVGDQYPLQHG